MKHGLLTIIALIALLAVTLAATQTAQAATQYATSAKYEATVDTIAQTTAQCIHADNYHGPITILSINSASGNAVVTASLGESATQIILQKKSVNGHITWACTGGSGGGAISDASLQRAGVPTQLHRALLTGKGVTPLLRRPLVVKAKPNSTIYEPQ